MLACGVVIPSGNVTLHSVNRGKAAILWACPERAQRVEREESHNRSADHTMQLA